MLFEPKDPNQEKDDFFDGPDIPEPVKEPKKPVYKPEDPDYWEEESEWEHLKPGNKSRVWLWLGVAVVLVVFVLACWMRYFSPYIEEATQYGYVESVERRGTVFKTYEGVLLPYKELTDTTRIYSRDFIFSVANRGDYRKLRQAQRDCRPVRVEYRRYHATLPWRGSSKTVITGVDSVDPSDILPPEFAPHAR
ncbi:MAG: hypothetical protein K2F94_02845 [Muribaculaceae bacterium]|nr:hypothetical protein [Muribaculaceae bacterium]